MPNLPESFKLLKDVGHKEIFLAFDRVPETSRLFVGSSGGKVYEVDPLAEKPAFREVASHESYVTGVAVIGETVISAGYEGKLVWRNAADGAEIRSVAAHSRWIRKLAVSPDQKRIATVADDMLCRIWNVETGEQVTELRGHELQTPNHFPSMLYTVTFSPDGKSLSTADRTGRINLWNLDDGAKKQTIEAPGFYTWDSKQRIHSIGGIRSLSFSPDSQQIAAGGIGLIGNIDHLEGPARVEIFSTGDGAKLHEFLGEAKGLVESSAWHPKGDWLVGCGGDNGGLVQFYDMETKKVAKSEKAPMHIHACRLNEAGDRLFAVGHGKIAVWELKS